MSRTKLPLLNSTDGQRPQFATKSEQGEYSDVEQGLFNASNSLTSEQIQNNSDFFDSGGVYTQNSGSDGDNDDDINKDLLTAEDNSTMKKTKNRVSFVKN